MATDKNTTNAQHTPGPWTYRLSIDGRICGDVRGPAGRFVADIGAHEESDANARLIASAPDLLAALRDALDLLVCDALADTSRECSDDELCDVCRAKDSITNVIRRATVAA